MTQQALAAKPLRLVGYIEANRVEMELKHWKTLHEVLVADQDPSAVLADICAKALVESPNDFEAGLQVVLEGWFQPWPSDLGVAI